MSGVRVPDGVPDENPLENCISGGFCFAHIHSINVQKRLKVVGLSIKSCRQKLSFGQKNKAQGPYVHCIIHPTDNRMIGIPQSFYFQKLFLF